MRIKGVMMWKSTSYDVEKY